MREYPEDKLYQSDARDYSYVFEEEIPSHPEYIRDMWGEPPIWMDWTGDDLNGGSYAGLHKQDDKYPFVFWGGGFSSVSGYDGPYVFICPPTKTIPKSIDLSFIHDPLSRVRFESYNSTNNYMEIRSNGGGMISTCSSQPVEHFSTLYIGTSKYTSASPYVKMTFPEFFDEIGRSISPIPDELNQYVELPNQYSEYVRVVARIKKKYNSNGQTFIVLELVSFQEREKWVEKPPMDKKDWMFTEWEFVVPPQVEKYAGQIKTENISYLNSIKMGEYNTALIFKDGLYLLNKVGAEPKKTENPF